VYTIGRLAHRARVNADSVRFYERQGLLTPSKKTASGYRLYGEDAVRRLAFIKHAQCCGFNLAEIRELLALQSRDEGARASAVALAQRKLGEMREMRAALSRMEHALAQVLESGVGPGPADAGEPAIITALEAACSAGAGGAPAGGLQLRIAAV
jgi:MerR family Zn(II)-responsive transcriptional regulator of zntA